MGRNVIHYALILFRLESGTVMMSEPVPKCGHSVIYISDLPHILCRVPPIYTPVSVYITVSYP